MLVPAPRLVSVESVYLARCVDGEYWWQDEELARWIAHSVINRVESGWWEGTVTDEVRSACHGYANVLWPEGWALDVAREALARNEDLAEGSLFFLSGWDLHMLGEKDGIVRQFCDKGYCISFFREWPGE